MNIKIFGGIHHLFTEEILSQSSRHVPVSCIEKEE